MWADLKYSARSFARAPGLTVALLITIAAGIGGNAVVLGFIRGLVVTGTRPASVTDGIVTVYGRTPDLAFEPLPFDVFAALRTRGEPFAAIGAAREAVARANIDGRLLYISAAHVTTELASLFDLRLQDGLVVSDRLWRTELTTAADRTATVRVDGIDMRVSGVAPEWLDGIFSGRPVDLWLPLDELALDDRDRRSPSYWVLGRLPATVSMNRAEAAVAAIHGDAIALGPYTGVAPDTAAGVAQLSRLLPGAAILVFVIACANVAAFLLSRAAARAHETSVRVALGAGRRELSQSLLADGVLIGVAGGAAGLLLATWTGDIIPALLFEQDASELQFRPDVSRVAAIAGLCAVIVAACGLVPLLDLRHDQPADVLRRESAGPSAAVRRLRSVLVVGQIGCCSVLIISTGVLLEGFRAALRTTAGRQAGSTIVAMLEWGGGFSAPDSAVAYFQRAEKKALALPEVVGVAWAATLPGGRPRWHSVEIEPAGQKAREVVLHAASFTPATLDRIDLPPLAGRMFGGRDVRGLCPVAIVNTAAASLLAPDASPRALLGRQLIDALRRPVQIVGVVSPSAAGVGAATIYYYAEQSAPPGGREGPAIYTQPITPADAVTATLDANLVSSTYFAAMGFEVVAGQLWRATPEPGSCPIAVVNEEAEQRYFGGRATGTAVIDEFGARTEIVGVVRTPPLRTSQRRVEPAIYLPTGQNFLPRMTMILQTRAATTETIAGIGHTLELASSGPQKKVMTLDEHLSRTVLAGERIATVLIGAAAALALGLAALGIYGAMADAVRRRRREFALRTALGAPRWRVVSQVIAEGVRLGSAGAAVGAAGSLAAAYWLARITPAAGSLSIATAIAGPMTIAILVLLACIVPARRALAADPLSIMRDH